MSGPVTVISVSSHQLPETATGDECRIQAEFPTGQSQWRAVKKWKGCLHSHRLLNRFKNVLHELG